MNKYKINKVIYELRKILINKSMIKKIKKISKKTDIISKINKVEINNYWNKYTNITKYWHIWYSSRNGLFDVRYIPENIFYTLIEPYYNKLDFYKMYQDKNIYDLIFHDIKKPITISKNMENSYFDDKFNYISKEEVINRCLMVDEIVIKPAIDSGGGRNISFLKIEDKTTCEMISNILDYYKNNFIIQVALKQSSKLSIINSESVNTIRLISFYNKGNVIILSSVLRMGVGKSRVDNQAAGGISCGIKNDGRLKKYGFNKYGERLVRHPNGFVFENYVVPSFKKIEELVRDLHKKIQYYRIISWDFAIDEYDSPVFIEYNLRFQEINFHQLNNGPLFGNLTDSVIEEVIKNN